jgi:hypothetical protein
VLLAGLLVGGLVGAVAGAIVGREPAAAALIRLTPLGNPALAALGGDQQAQPETEDYVASELVYLSSPTMLRAVQEKLGLQAPPDFTATQNSTSPLITLSATADSDQEAIGVVAAAIDVYTQRQREQAEQRTSAALAAIDDTVRELNDRGGAEDALLDRLENLRADIQLRAGQDAGFEIVEAPVATSDGGSPWALGGMFGAALGGLIAVGGLMLHRQLSRRLHEAHDLTGVADRVLHPRVDRHLAWSAALPEDDDRRRLARLLLTQLGTPPAEGTRVIVVVGASAASGTSVVASLLAVAAAEHDRTLLVSSAERMRKVLTELDGGGCVVVDAASVTGAATYLDVVDEATDIVLVACLGLDRPGEAASVAAAATSPAVTVSAVLTTSSLRERLRSWLPLWRATTTLPLHPQRGPHPSPFPRDQAAIEARLRAESEAQTRPEMPPVNRSGTGRYGGKA